MDTSSLHRLDLAPDRVGADCSMETPVDGQDYVGLPGEDLLRRDFDDRARAGILADDVTGTDEIDDLAADRTGDGAFETMRATGDIDARASRRWDFCSLFPDIRDHCSGVAGERLGALLSIERPAESAQCFSRNGEEAADQRRWNVRLLLPRVARGDMGGRRRAH